MEPVTAAAIATAASAGMNYLSQQNAANQQIKLFRKQKAWEKEKMTNAYQWMMGDIQKAGLNPTLMMGDSASPTMAGSSTPSPVGTPSNSFGSDMVSAMRLSKELGLMDAQKENIDADTELKGTQAGKTSAETEFQKIQNKYQEKLIDIDMALKEETNRQIRADVKEKMQRIENLQKEIDKTEKEIDILKSQGKITEADAKTRVNNRRAFAILEMAESASRSLGNTIGAVKGTSAMPMNINSNSNSVRWLGQAQ